MFVSSNTGRIIESFTFRYSKGTLIVIAVFCCNVEINYVVYEKWPAIDLCVSRFCWLSLFFFFGKRGGPESRKRMFSVSGKCVVDCFVVVALGFGGQLVVHFGG